MPVKYEFYDMAGQVIGSNSATDAFPVRQCSPADAGNPKLVSVLATMHTSDDAKEQSTNYDLYLSSRPLTSRNHITNYTSTARSYKYKEGPTSTEYAEHSV